DVSSGNCSGQMIPGRCLLRSGHSFFPESIKHHLPDNPASMGQAIPAKLFLFHQFLFGKIRNESVPELHAGQSCRSLLHFAQTNRCRASGRYSPDEEMPQNGFYSFDWPASSSLWPSHLPGERTVSLTDGQMDRPLQ